MKFRKYFIFGIFLLITTLSCGQDIITVDGNIPVILSAPHGGSKESSNVTNRHSGVTTKDAYTIELLQEIAQHIQLNLKRQPSIVYSNRHRKEIDFNRPVQEAFEDEDLERLYYQYHFEMQNQIMKNIWSDSVIMLIDIHGQAHKHEMLEIGLDKKEFTDIDYVIGDMFIKNKISSYPATNISKPVPYFDGGYTIETYKEYPNVIAIQLEVPQKYRKNSKQRKEFAKKTAIIIIDYYKVLQKEKHEDR